MFQGFGPPGDLRGKVFAECFKDLLPRLSGRQEETKTDGQQVICIGQRAVEKLRQRKTKEPTERKAGKNKTWLSLELSGGDSRSTASS